MSKCWFVDPYGGDGVEGVYILVETRARAKSDAMNVDESGWLADIGFTGLRALRAPSFDGGFTTQDLIATAFATVECSGCGQTLDRGSLDGEGDYPVDADDETRVSTDPVFDGVDVYCCPQCRAKTLIGLDEPLDEPHKPVVMTNILVSNWDH